MRGLGRRGSDADLRCDIGLKKDGTPDKRVSSEHGFGSSEGADPHEAGRLGGKSSYENGGLTQ